jgi:pentapeptide MXKDX repeat protein
MYTSWCLSNPEELFSMFKRISTLATATVLALSLAAPAFAQSMKHDSMSHGTMKHSSMSHGTMKHSSMSHGAMKHSSMSHGAMKHDSMTHGSMKHDSMHHGNMGD